MKTVIALALILIASSLSAATIVGARYDRKADQIVMMVEDGSCIDHEYSLQFENIDYNVDMRSHNAYIVEERTEECIERATVAHRISVGRAIQRPSYLNIYTNDGSSVTVRVE